MAAHTAATDPLDEDGEQTAARLTIAPSWVDPKTGATYVHADLRETVKPWESEAHVAPITRAEWFGDVESWTAYVLRYRNLDERGSLLTWSERGLSAILDYHMDLFSPGRCQWSATHPFERSLQWLAWERLANGTPRTQKQALEALEDLATNIVEPDAPALFGILGKLRATSNATAETELRPDGTTNVTFTKNNSVQAGEVNLPPEFTIAIPVLKGHVETAKDGKAVPVHYRLGVRVRVSVDDSAHLALRFTMPGAERTLETVYADRVAATKALLGEEHDLLRAAT